MKDMDAFLVASKDDINTLIKEGDNPAIAEELGKELEKQFLAYLQGNSIGGESIKQKIDNSLQALMHVWNKTAKLAANKGLNPTEKKARRAIAIMMTTIDRASAGNDPNIKLPGERGTKPEGPAVKGGQGTGDRDGLGSQPSTSTPPSNLPPSPGRRK